MKKSELIKFRKEVKKEIERRKVVLELLQNENVRSVLQYYGINEDSVDINNTREIIERMLWNFKVTETNGIYVCTQAYDEDEHAPVRYYMAPDGKYLPERKRYMDIESREEVVTSFYGPSIMSFERSHIVLNPNNAPFDDDKIKANGFNEVRLDFFEGCYNNGQNEAVKMILKKYPRMGEYK